MPALRGCFCYGAGTAAPPFSVRFLIDNALPPRLAELLVAAGQDAVHVRAYEMHGSSDEQIVDRARHEGRIIVSADTDFGAILASQQASHPSFILFRDTNLHVAHDYLNILLPAFQRFNPN